MSASNSSNNLVNNAAGGGGGETEGSSELANKIASSPRQRQHQPSLLDSLMDTPAQNATDAGFGILCNDPTGLCLSATGNFVSDNNNQHPQQNGGGSSSSNVKLMNTDDSLNTGIYTSLTKLAHQLQPGPGSTDSTSAAPLITIETEDYNILLKEYDGHAIALKVPAALGAPNNSNGNSEDAAGGNASDGPGASN